MSSLRLDPPPKFSFEPKDWTIWKTHFERYRKTTGLNKEEDENQINALLYIMGIESENIYNSFKFEKKEDKVKAKFETILAKFDAHFLPKRNVIHERYVFFSRFQQEEGSSEKFITDLHKLAETCEFGEMREEMIRDRIVVGVSDQDLSRKLQMDHSLTLTRAIEVVRMSELINEQQGIQRQGTSLESSVNRVRKSSCSRCGGFCRSRFNCPARNATCHRCSRKGHYAQQCQAAKRINRVAEESDEDYSDLDFCVG